MFCSRMFQRLLAVSQEAFARAQALCVRVRSHRTDMVVDFHHLNHSHTICATQKKPPPPRGPLERPILIGLALIALWHSRRQRAHGWSLLVACVFGRMQPRAQHATRSLPTHLHGSGSRAHHTVRRRRHFGTRCFRSCPVLFPQFRSLFSRAGEGLLKQRPNG